MIPFGIQRDNVLKAFRTIDREGVPSGRDSRGVTIEHENRHYPVKLVISLAAEDATGRELPGSSFITTEAVALLSRLGFRVNRVGTSDSEPQDQASLTKVTLGRTHVRKRMERRVTELINSPATYLDAFERAHLFTGSEPLLSFSHPGAAPKVSSSVRSRR